MESERGPHAVLAVAATRKDGAHTVAGRTVSGLIVEVTGRDFELVREVAAHLFNATEELRPAPPKEGMN